MSTFEQGKQWRFQKNCHKYSPQKKLFIDRGLREGVLKKTPPIIFKGLFCIVILLLSPGCSDEVNPLQTTPEEIADKTKELSIQNETELKVSNQTPSEVRSVPLIVDSDTNPEIRPPVDKNLEEKTIGKIRREPSEDDRIRPRGIWIVRSHLDKERINRLNKMRDPDAFNSYPELFGIESDFKPLLSLEGKGPGRVRITGESLETMDFEIGPDKEKIEVYPNFRAEFLHSEKTDQREKIEITFIEGTKENLVDQFRVTWSNQRELFIEDPNLNDIVPLITPNYSDEAPKFKDVKEWLRAACAGLNKYNINFEEVRPDKPYLRVRTSKEMRESRKANAYDLCTWLATKAIENGFEAEIIVLPYHCLLSVSNYPSRDGEIGSQEQSYIETSILLDKEKIVQGAFEEARDITNEKVELALKTGQERVSEEFKRGADKMIALKIKEWYKMYKQK
jgi:hypothetical protein